ncbi:MAG: hypothetical protein RTU30_05380 [Candidatus Thorarchaeota archaeon]
MDENTGDSQVGKGRAEVIGVFIGIIALCAPYAFSWLYHSHDGFYFLELWALTWLGWSHTLSPVFVYPMQIVANPIHSFLRLGFAYQMYRAYLIKSTRNQALYVGCASELWQLILSVQYNMHVSLGPLQLIAVPIPILLLLGLTILIAIPPPEPPPIVFISSV